MASLKRLARSHFVQKSVGILAAEYLRFVWLTNRSVLEPADIYERMAPQLPVIIAMWHGQHFLVPFIRKNYSAKVLISRHRDGSGWLSEETEDDPARLSAKRVWIVDPIDGTRAFIAGFPDWTISIGLAEAGRPIVGAIFAPVTDQLFVAVAGGGATCNGRSIAASAGTSLAHARVAGPPRRLERLAPLDIIAEPKVHSLALRIARVADGSLDAALAGPDGHDWDLAAADLLVHEAHGALTTLAGETLTYNRPKPIHGALLAAGRARHAVLRDLLREGSVAFR